MRRSVTHGLHQVAWDPGAKPKAFHLLLAHHWMLPLQMVMTIQQLVSLNDLLMDQCPDANFPENLKRTFRRRPIVLVSKLRQVAVAFFLFYTIDLILQ